MAWRSWELCFSGSVPTCRQEPGVHGASGMRAGKGRRARDALWSGDRGADGDRAVSVVVPSWFLAGAGGKYSSLRTIWLRHVERRAQPCGGRGCRGAWGSRGLGCCFGSDPQAGCGAPRAPHHCAAVLCCVSCTGTVCGRAGARGAAFTRFPSRAAMCSRPLPQPVFSCHYPGALNVPSVRVCTPTCFFHLLLILHQYLDKGRVKGSLHQPSDL